ncbi:protein LIGHT-DEPENDENT SHORT HYPOCOTYLS 5-like [Zingiber officinale]|uniref:ALOG domain-containing protein n=1 Tax=Zingiber officinale TaxID=94328 RepID=A0A8J5CXB8_ZINOF|nr:protein LIGHT-DEPENDENT SHORT HYPOCOTYLS 5-like [Zingiber officinale]KAG6473648.1 hypothetical protein ZIOFF_067565 [Zingiber officinale]
MEPAAVDSPVPGGGRDNEDDAPDPPQPPPPPQQQQQQKPSRYESQKRRDWNTFLQFLSNHYKPALPLALCGGPHVVEFLKYLDQFGKTKVHVAGCSHFGLPRPPGPCGCPTRQAWGSLDALIGRLRAAYDENASPTAGGPNPFGARAVKAHLREVRESQAKARGVAYDKKKRKRRHQLLLPPSGEGSSSAAISAATAVTVAVAGSSTTAAATDQGGSLGIRDPGHADETGNLTSDS